jgi:prophage antirepressor-like protein
LYQKKIGGNEMDKFEIFNNTNLGQLTAIFGDNGNIWFLTKDVAKILCMKAEHALRLVDPEDRTEFFINIGTGRRKYQCVNEYGIYEMIFASKKQEAKTFRKWVTHEVLPSIRKNGGYIIGQEELKGEEKEKLEEQIRQLAKQVNAYREDGNLWMNMYFNIQKDYLDAVEKIYGKKTNIANDKTTKTEYVVSPEGWILPKSLYLLNDND